MAALFETGCFRYETLLAVYEQQIRRGYGVIIQIGRKERAQFAERLAQGRDEDASREEQRTANRDFSQVYPKGWTRIRALLNESKSRAPLLLYTFIAEHMDADGGALVVDQKRCAKPWAFRERRSGERSLSLKSAMRSCV